MSRAEGGRGARGAWFGETRAGVTVENCTATAQASSNYNGDGAWALGGGIYSYGVLTVVDSTVRNNQAVGSDGATFTSNLYAGRGGSALGGGVYLAGGIATLTNSTFASNAARGGNGANGGSAHSKFFGALGFPGGPGGDGLGGAIYAAGGTVELRGTTITQNSAAGGTGGNSPKGLAKGANGAGRGGGIYIAPTASVGLDAFTQANTKSNTASTSDSDIFGSFSIL